MRALAPPGRPVRRRFRVAGVVQGVGFRPFVHRLATELGLAGHVGNDGQGVFVEVEGTRAGVECFGARLVEEVPPLARVDDVFVETRPVVGEYGFRIVESRFDGPVHTFVSPDVAVCDDCLAELFDPANRRYRYPFINCTNCGPRFTITIRLPYDRPNTTMRSFELCPECAKEYHDPGDRRFHAQPVACAACGPRVWFEDRRGVVQGTDAALGAARTSLAQGGVVAVKGLGGYHLACDATSSPAVEQLRARKGRPAKPLAVMARDLAVAREVAHIDGCEEALLVSPQRPIVLLAQRRPSALSGSVAPGNPYVGVLLPYTPLHHLLLAPEPGGEGPRLVVMTSGNSSDEPICYDDADARRRLGDLVDGWLIHDRPIHVPCDDSVVRVEAGGELPIRRSRGYAPLPVPLPFEMAPTVAVGGELKTTFCLAAGPRAWMSQHIGDMGSIETLDAFERSLHQFTQIYDVQPRGVAVDGHPGYQTRRWAQERAGHPVEIVQHHHAHVAAVMAEHLVPLGEPVVGVAFDGTGYGSDGAIWGGEILVVTYDQFERAAHLRYVPLPGGDAAVRKPYRAALAHLWSAQIGWAADLPPVRAAPGAELAVIERQLQRGFQCAPTSSMGRLFDAVSSLLGIRQVVSYEAQAAIELEAVAAAHVADAPHYRFEVTDGIIDPRPLLQAVVADIRAGRPAGPLAAGFHLAVARLIGEIAPPLCRAAGTDRVALSGGVFQNVLLVGLVRTELTRRHLQVLTHRRVPPNDGGLALGQAVVAGSRRGPGGT